MFGKGSDTTSSIQYIGLEKHKESFELFYKNLAKSLQKLPSGKKTKTLHQLIDARVLGIGYGSTDLKNPEKTIYAVNFWSSNTFQLCLADVVKLSNPITQDEIISSVTLIKKSSDEINSLSTRLTDYGPKRMDDLKNIINQEFTKILENIDYLSLLDTYYHYYCKYLAMRLLQENPKKLYEEYITIVENSIKDIIKQYGDLNNPILISMIVTYCVIRQHTKENPKKIVDAIDKTFNNSEDFALFNSLSPHRYEGVKDIAYLITETKMINITPNSLFHKLKIKFGEKFPQFFGETDDIFAYFCSTNYNTEIFGQSNKFGSEIESLILNAKGRTRVQAFSKFRTN